MTEASKQEVSEVSTYVTTMRRAPIWSTKLGKWTGELEDRKLLKHLYQMLIIRLKQLEEKERYNKTIKVNQIIYL